MNSSDFLTKLAAAQTDEERAWITTESLIATLSLELQSIVWAAAILHWFTPEILAALRPELADRAADLDTELQVLSFVEPFSKRGHNIHDRTRCLLLDKLWQQELEVFQRLSSRAANYFSQEDGFINEIEWLYHLVVLPNWQENNNLSNLAQTWLNNFRKDELEALMEALSKQVEANRTSPDATAEIQYWNGKARSRFYGNEGAQKYYEEALTLYRDIENRLGEANTIKAIGDVLKFQDCCEEAQSHYTEALSLYRGQRSRLGEANTIRAMGDVLKLQGSYEKAHNNYAEALTLYRDEENRPGEADTIQAIGDVLKLQSHYAEALNHYKDALTLYRDIKDCLGEGNALKGMGDVLKFQNSHTEARSRYEESLTQYRKADRLCEESARRAIEEMLSHEKESVK